MPRGRVWTNAEDIILQDLYRKSYSDLEISKKLNRTIRAISIRRSILFLVKNKKIHWTKDEKENLINLRKQGKRVKEIATILNMDYERVRNKLRL